jgi:transcription initiation factor TFIID subunit 1
MIQVRQESWPFIKPVNKKLVKGYYDIIKNPMDLETMTKKVSAHRYHSRIDFLADIQLIASNSEKFNGADSKLTKEAKMLVDFTKMSLEGLDISHLEENIAKVQERAKEMDFNWGDDESFAEFPSRRMSMEGDEGDGDSRPGPSVIPPQPEVKRARGRPRKHPGAATSKYVKKDKTKTVEEVIDVVGDFGPGPSSKSEQSSFSASESFGMAFDVSNPDMSSQTMMMQQHIGQDDSQQAAEAMIQMAYYPSQPQQDESMDFDPNYDPSDFLMKKDPNVPIPPQAQESFQDGSYDYSASIQEGAGGDEVQMQQNYYGTFNQQSFNVADYSFQQQQQQSQQPMLQEDYSQSQPNDGGGLADLEISESSEDENENEANDNSENVADTSKDGDLWF